MSLRHALQRRSWWLLLGGVLLAAPVLEAGDVLLRDLAFRWRGPRPAPPQLVILEIDESSINLVDRLAPQEIATSPLWRQMGSWPWRRALQAELAAQVLEAGAQRVLFAVLHRTPSSFGVADDQAFQRRLAPWKDRVVLLAGYSRSEAGRGVVLEQLQQPVYRLGAVGLDVLLEGATGQIEAIPGRAWQQQVLADLPEPHPAALAFSLRPGPSPLAPLGIDFLGPAGTVPVVPAWTLPQLPAGFWRDRIVLIGATPSRLSDRRPSPFGPLSSVELQAAALATVLQHRGFQPLPGPLELLLLASWGGLAVLWLGRSSTAAATATRALLQALLGLGLGGLAWLAGWWLPVAALALAPLLAGGGRALGQWRRESLERAYLHQVLARRVSPALLQDILSNPGPLGTQLGGSRTQCAVLFTDLVGFTPLSAQLEAAVLFDLLNRYFEAIAAAVIAEEGLLDKFIGDALMAEFGVPRSRGLAVEALAAVRAALAMQQALDALNQQLTAEGLPPLRQGIGIHVGEVIAGNLGSSQRLEFTVVGASVNLASRLEGLTRRFPQFPVLISGAVLALLPDQLEVTALGEHPLKGWPEPVAVYGLTGFSCAGSRPS